MSSPDHFTHILTPSIWCNTTPRYYFWGNTFMIRNQKCSGKKSAKGTFELMSTRTNWVPVLMVLMGGVIWAQVNWTTLRSGLVHHMPLLGCMSELRWASPWVHLTVHVKLTWCSSALSHQMPLPGVHLNTGQPDQKANQMSCWPDVVPLFVIRCLNWGVHLTNMMTYNVTAFKCHHASSIELMQIELEMYVDWSLCFCCHC